MKKLSQLINNQIKDWSLDQQFYKDEAIFDLEIEKIYMNSWLLAGHESQIPNTGDYFLFSLLTESVIIIRGKDGVIRAFMNVCRHRGSHICLESQGNIKRLTCPYHAWTYNLEGALVAAKNLSSNIDKDNLSLHHCSVDVIEGLIMINFSDNPTSLKMMKQELSEPMQMFGMKDLKIAAHRSYSIQANWKLSVENYNECYHCAPAHPEYSKSHSLKFDESSEEYQSAQKLMKDSLTQCGMKDYNISAEHEDQIESQEQYAYHRYALFDGYLTGSENGQGLAPLIGAITDYNPGASDFSLGPVSFLLAYSDHVVAYVFTPVEHHASQCDVYWMVDKTAKEGVDYDLERLVWLWDATTKADERIIANNQKGVNSRKYTSGPFSEKESTEKRFISWYLDQLRETL